MPRVDGTVHGTIRRWDRDMLSRIPVGGIALGREVAISKIDPEA